MMQNLDFLKKRTFALFAILAIAIAVPATVFVAQQQQEIRQRAAEITVSYGSINGTVRNVVGNPLIPGVTVTLVGTTRTTITDATGAWWMKDVPSGTRTFSFAKTGFETKTASAVIPEGSSISLHVQLTPVPQGSINGTVRNIVGNVLLPGVAVNLVGTTRVTTTDTTGAWWMNNVPAGVRQFSFSKTGFAPKTASATIPTTGSIVLHVQLTPTTTTVAPTQPTTPTPTRVATPTPTRAPTPTPTRGATPTPTGRPTATPTPTQPPNPTGYPNGYGDNILDLKDYNIWLSCFQKTNIGGCSRADVNDDGQNDVASGPEANAPTNMQDYVWLITSMATQFGD